MKPKIICSLLMGISLPLLGQDTPPSYWQADQALEQRLTTLIELQQRNQSEELKDLQADLEKLRHESENHLDWRWIVGFLGIGTLAGGATFFTYLSKVRARMNAQVNAMLADSQERWEKQKEEIVSGTSERLRLAVEQLEAQAPELLLKGLRQTSESSQAALAQLLANYDYEARVLPSKPLLVLVQNDHDAREAKRLLCDDLGFTQLVVRHLTPSEQPTYEELLPFALIILWEFATPFQVELIEPFLQRTRESSSAGNGLHPITYLIYTPGHNSLLPANREVAHAANSRFALYARIAETHRYNDALRRKSSSHSITK